MRLSSLIPVVLLAGGCADSTDDYPVSTNDPVAPSTGSTTTAPMLSGRVCVVTDPRALTTCSATGAGGLVVSAGGAVVQTSADGTFSIPVPAHPSMTALQISGAGIVPTQLPASSAMSSVPVLQSALYQQMIEATGFTVTPGTGAVLASVTRNGQPVSGVTMTSSPIGGAGPFFDGATATGFTPDATGTRGIVWAPGIAMGTASLTFRDPQQGIETTVGGVQVVDGGLTLTDAILE